MWAGAPRRVPAETTVVSAAFTETSSVRERSPSGASGKVETTETGKKSVVARAQGERAD